jgi:hypothetical protein
MDTEADGQGTVRDRAVPLVSISYNATARVSPVFQIRATGRGVWSLEFGVIKY